MKEQKSILVNIEINEWEKYNPRSDRISYTWFRLQNDIVVSPKYFGWTSDQRIIWIGMLAEYSRNSCEPFVLNTTWLSQQLNIQVKLILSAIQLLIENNMVTCSNIDEWLPPRHHHDTTWALTDRQTDKHICTVDTSQHNFEELYKNHYPKRTKGNMGKAVGMKKAVKKFKSQESYDKFKVAVLEFKKLVDNGSYDKNYIPMWSTFVNSRWEDFLPENNESSKRSPFATI